MGGLADITPDSAQLARLKRTRDRLRYVLDLTEKQALELRHDLYEVNACIDEEERR